VFFDLSYLPTNNRIPANTARTPIDSPFFFSPNPLQCRANEYNQKFTSSDQNCDCFEAWLYRTLSNESNIFLRYQPPGEDIGCNWINCDDN